jgi:transcriptional regulator with XRE-family HTH domain
MPSAEAQHVDQKPIRFAHGGYARRKLLHTLILPLCRTHVAAAPHVPAFRRRALAISGYMVIGLTRRCHSAILGVGTHATCGAQFCQRRWSDSMGAISVRPDGAMIRRLRKRLGLSQAEAATRTGVSRSSWVRYEGGKQPIAVAHAQAVAMTLNVAVDVVAPELRETDLASRTGARVLDGEVEGRRLPDVCGDVRRLKDTYSISLPGGIPGSPGSHCVVFDLVSVVRNGDLALVQPVEGEVLCGRYFHDATRDLTVLEFPGGRLPPRIFRPGELRSCYRIIGIEPS